jgi:RecB family endonuclease NucS
MPIYEARPEGLHPLTATSFEAEGWRERGDIQRLLKDRIASLEDGLMVLTDEFSGWADSTRRIDLLCLDDEANLVVVELKRNEDGGHMELQALRYAAMVSAMTFEQAVETLAEYRDRGNPDPATACADNRARDGR